MSFTNEEKRFLAHISTTENGRDLVALLNHAKDHYSSINTIDSKADYGAQVEGRKLFIKFIDDLVTQMNVRRRNPQPVRTEDYT